jgi:hypothetical protein
LKRLVRRCHIVTGEPHHARQFRVAGRKIPVIDRLIRVAVFSG